MNWSNMRDSDVTGIVVFTLLLQENIQMLAKVEDLGVVMEKCRKFAHVFAMVSAVKSSSIFGD
jgi:hypothetical protein